MAGESFNIREASLVPSFDLDGASNGAEGETDREVEGEGGEEREAGMGREEEEGEAPLI